MSFCSCEVDPYDRPVVYSEADTVARKSHNCCECREAILPGEQYVVIRGVWDGHGETFKMCRLCRAIARDLAPGCNLGELRDHLWECLGFDYVTGRLTDWAAEDDDESEADDAD